MSEICEMPSEIGLRKPDISVVVVVYNIPREAPRALLSLAASYTRITADLLDAGFKRYAQSGTALALCRSTART